MKIIRLIFQYLKNMKSNSCSSCYTSMENRGIATMGCCSGLAGGDKNTNYLQYECIDCPHYVDCD